VEQLPDGKPQTNCGGREAPPAIMRIADRYVLTEALGPFLVALGAFIVLITGHMLFQVVEVIVEHGVPLPSVLRFVALQIPHATVMALPVATLMGCSLAVNRLSSDHEIVAMRSGGLSLARMMAPMWALGLVASLGTLAMSEEAVPWSRAQAERLIREMVLRRQSLAFEPGKFTDTGQALTIYVGDRSADEGELRDVMIFMTQRNDYPMLFSASRAVFRGERLYPVSPNLYFFDGRSVTTLRSAGVEVDLRQVATGAAGGIPGTLGMQEMTIRDLVGEYREREQQSEGAGRSYAMEAHSRLAMAASCLVFAALAGPVTLRFARGQSLVGVMAAMIITFGYFLVMIWTRQLGEGGALPVPVAAWAQNVLLIAAAALGLYRLR
jgi:lipopolysaccharide export system permease protein